MKKMLLAVLLGSMVAGCASAPVALAPVGPNPAGSQGAGSDGQLEIYSALFSHAEGADPTWYRHTDYTIYTQDGKRLEHVFNSTGKYSQAPRLVALPSGQYIVEARAKGMLDARVPVVVKAGEITSVHLDGKWQPGADVSQTALVNAPAGYAVGWRAGQ